ncbi:MAG: IS66 family transposase [Candidatus Rokuibacteriota bacterium]
MLAHSTQRGQWPRLPAGCPSPKPGPAGKSLICRLQSTYEALGQRLLTEPVVHADETWWPLLDRRPSKRWWVWSVASETGVLYRIQNLRSAEAAGKLLGGYQGVVMADGYGAAALADSMPRVWAPTRSRMAGTVRPDWRGPRPPTPAVARLLARTSSRSSAAPAGD